MLAVHASSAADQPVQLGVRQQDHQHLPAARDTALAQLVSQLRAGELPSARQCLRDGGDRLVDRTLVEAVAVAQLLAGDPPHAGTCQVEQPADVLGPHEVPRRPQHVRAEDGAVAQERRQIGLVRLLCARGHCPSRLTGVFCLDGQQRTDSLARRHGVRPHQVLTAQSPAGNVEILDHAATLLEPSWNRLTRRTGIRAPQRRS